MFITSISLSYVFLIIGVISLIFFLYFKFITSSTSEESHRRDKILGNMKDPESWRETNNRMGYVSLFWFIVSIAAFIYLKFFLQASLISIIIPFTYIALIIISSFLFGRRKVKA